MHFVHVTILLYDVENLLERAWMIIFETIIFFPLVNSSLPINQIKSGIITPCFCGTHLFNTTCCILLGEEMGAAMWIKPLTWKTEHVIPRRSTSSWDSLIKNFMTLKFTYLFKYKKNILGVVIWHMRQYLSNIIFFLNFGKWVCFSSLIFGDFIFFFFFFFFFGTCIE